MLTKPVSEFAHGFNASLHMTADHDGTPTSPSSTSLSDDSVPTSTRRFPCKHEGCGKDFSTSGQLSRHNRIHKGIKRFQCDVEGCARTFFRADNREQHSRSHKRRLSLMMLRESEKIACKVLLSGVTRDQAPSASLFADTLSTTPPTPPATNAPYVYTTPKYSVGSVNPSHPRHSLRVNNPLPACVVPSSITSGVIVISPHKNSIKFLCD
ncbi:hypothetical protein BC830DRAFT_1082153 [Chytriomyces sp. MP71]|nr:hypothetical protein BC830DRAFT_1082153 [Chytriomyces sp. MP71]